MKSIYLVTKMKLTIAILFVGLSAHLVAGNVQLVAKLADKQFKTIEKGNITLTFTKNGEEKVLDFGVQ